MSNTAGLTSTLYINQAYASINNGSISNPTSNLLDFNMNTFSSTTPYTQTSYTYGWLLPDTAGNLWAVETQIPSSTNNSGLQASYAIVKFSGASSTPSSLSPTTVITLPSNIHVQSLAFDSSQNLYLDEESTTSTTGNIVKYAAPSYASPTTIVNYSPSGGSTSSCTPSAYLAFDTTGNLWAAENYYTASGCSDQIAEYNTTGTLLNHYGTLAGNHFSILFDSFGNMWGLQQSCSGSYCNSNTTAAVWEWNGAPNGSNNPTTPVVTLPSGISPSGSSIQAVFDGNGNLWFNASNSTGSGCSNNSYIFELPGGTSTLNTAKTYGSCNFLFGIAVTPAPAGYPVN
ncbi:MAG: hypothetical protein ACYDAM_12170 [Leptospirales bacterium]